MPAKKARRHLVKIAIYFAMFIPAACIAALYGALHNQISYSFSNEYFTHFKFIQFNIPWAQTSPRLAAALVGALATWWMGVLLFSVLGLLGFMFTCPKTMAIALLKSVVIVVAVALVTGLTGLLYGYTVINEETIAHYTAWVRPNVTHPIQFVRVGFMHNASYVGGLLGLLFGGAYLALLRRRKKVEELLKHEHAH